MTNGEALWLLFWLLALGWMEHAERLRFGLMPWRSLAAAALLLLVASYTSEEPA